MMKARGCILPFPIAGLAALAAWSGCAADNPEPGVEEASQAATAPIRGPVFASPVTWNGFFCTAGERCFVADVTGDGKADLVVVTTSNQVWVAVAGSDGESAPSTMQWHNGASPAPCQAGETCVVADMDGDLKADIVAFNRGSLHQAFVSYSNGAGSIATGSFTTRAKVSDFFCLNGEICDAADVTGDGRADIIAMDTSARAFVQRSSGNRSTLLGGIEAWGSGMCLPGRDDKLCKFGDVDGDGKKDLVQFVVNTGVQVGISTGSGFGTPARRGPFICAAGETCTTANLNGDRTDDIIAVQPDGDVFVSMSISGTLQPVSKLGKGTGTGGQQLFADVNGDKRADHVWFRQGNSNDVQVFRSGFMGDDEGGFSGKRLTTFGDTCVSGERCFVADVTGDGIADLVVIRADGSVRVAPSNGGSATSNQTWNGTCPSNETCTFADMDGDQKADLVEFTRANPPVTRVWFSSGSQSSGFLAPTVVSGFFCQAGEMCFAANVDGDIHGTADLVAFQSQLGGDAFVATSTGNRSALLNGVQNWGAGLCKSGEDCQLGDYDGDGRKDIVKFVRDGAGTVKVASSSGFSFKPFIVRGSGFCKSGEQCFVTNADGNQTDDLIAILPDPVNQIWVGISNGFSFDTREWALSHAGGVHRFGNVTTKNGRADHVWFSQKAASPHSVEVAPSGTLNNIFPAANGKVIAGTNGIIPTYVIWYGNWAANAAHRNLVANFLNNVGASPWWNIAKEYGFPFPSGRSPRVGTPGMLKQANATGKTALVRSGQGFIDTDVHQIVTNAIAANAGWKTDPTAIYLVMTATDISEGTDDGSEGLCNGYNGWHTISPNTGLNYAIIGDPARCGTATAGTSPNGNPAADATVAYLAHELAEGAVNAGPRASGFSEIADMCGRFTGTTFTTPNGATANMTLGGINYMIPAIFDPTAFTCAIKR
jgi:hypothetical protein